MLDPLGGDLGKYRLIAEIARGGMGIAYLAVKPGPDGFRKLVVVKELRPELIGDAACVAMFMDEARLAARLNHPNIAQTLEVGTSGSRRFIAMEYLDGQSLQQLASRALGQSTRMPLRMHLGILLDVLSALEYAHEFTDFDGTPLGVVHRDVSPHNVMVTYEGQIKLVDFGISEVATVGQPPRPGMLQGKIRYMSPEQAAGIHADRRADLFSVGAMLWEGIVGHRPWEGKTDAEVLQSLTAGRVPLLRDAWPDVDPGLAAIVERAMSADPRGRYPTALTMREDLERYIATRNLTPPSAPALGAWISKLFAVDREERRALIDSRLRSLTGADSGRRASSPPSTAPTTAAVSGVSAQTSVDEGTLWSLTPARRRRRWLVPAGIACAFAAIFGLGGVEAYRTHAPDSRRPPGAGVAALPVAPATQVVATDVAQRKAHVVIVASPASAQIYIDDEAVSNPYIARQTISPEVHRLRIESPGYETATRTVTFSEDIDLEFGLSRETPVATPLNTTRRAVRAVSPPAAAHCQPPYVVDSDTGKKRWKLECLESDGDGGSGSGEAESVRVGPR